MKKRKRYSDTLRPEIQALFFSLPRGMIAVTTVARTGSPLDGGFGAEPLSFFGFLDSLFVFC